MAVGGVCRRRKSVGLKNQQYNGKVKGCGRGKGRVIGWIPTRTWARVAWVIITVNYYYLLDIIRTVVEEVEGIERVTSVLISLIYLSEFGKSKKTHPQKTRVGYPSEKVKKPAPRS
jgi:hypothetical protein